MDIRRQLKNDYKNWHLTEQDVQLLLRLSDDDLCFYMGLVKEYGENWFFHTLVQFSFGDMTRDQVRQDYEKFVDYRARRNAPVELPIQPDKPSKLPQEVPQGVQTPEKDRTFVEPLVKEWSSLIGVSVDCPQDMTEFLKPTCFENDPNSLVPWDVFHYLFSGARKGLLNAIVMDMPYFLQNLNFENNKQRALARFECAFLNRENFLSASALRHSTLEDANIDGHYYLHNRPLKDYLDVEEPSASFFTSLFSNSKFCSIIAITGDELQYPYPLQKK